MDTGLATTSIACDTIDYRLGSCRVQANFAHILIPYGRFGTIHTAGELVHPDRAIDRSRDTNKRVDERKNVASDDMIKVRRSIHAGQMRVARDRRVDVVTS